jgi:hypothetical protein
MLCGDGHEHRRRWIRQRLRELSEIYAIDIVAFVVMSNHMHVLLWTDPDRVRSWSDREVAARWLRLFPTSAAAGAKDLETAIQWLAMDGARIKLLRGRLADLSWFMKCLKEPIARRANREDDCTGAFWEGRFKCFRVVDEGGALSCSVYIDLNVIFAGLADFNIRRTGCGWSRSTSDWRGTIGVCCSDSARRATWSSWTRWGGSPAAISEGRSRPICDRSWSGCNWTWGTG